MEKEINVELLVKVIKNKILIANAYYYDFFDMHDSTLEQYKNLIESVRDFYEDKVVGDELDVVPMFKNLQELDWRAYEKLLKELKKEKVNMDAMLSYYNNYIDKNTNSYVAMICKSVDRFLDGIKNDHYLQEKFYKKLYKELTVAQVSDLKLEEEYEKELSNIKNIRK